MEGESHSVQLCVSGCGFFGSPATDGMCSKCHKDSLKKKQQSPEMTLTSSVPQQSPEMTLTSSVPPAPNTSCIDPDKDKLMPVHAEPSASKDTETEEEAAACTILTLSNEESNESQENKSDKDALKKKNRCALCRKKVGLTGFDCRCGGLYCSAHRYSDKHDCTFDYRELGVQEIRRKNPVVTGQKIQKI